MELAKLKSIWKKSNAGINQPSWGLDLLEVYCSPDSEITRQAVRLGLKVKRFTRQDGDLSTPVGQAALWKILEEERPRGPIEVWVAPDCKHWGIFSRRNMGRSISSANKVPTGRENEKVHLRLCNDVYWFQMVNGGHFHLEQPQGSEAILQPEVRDIYHGTLCTTFDMCEVGKLLAPKVMQRTRGNNYLRKRTTVYTSSKVFHEAFDHRYCPGNHQHVPIAGKVFHLGKWISVSEYAARYSSGFGRNVARYLYCGVAHVPLMWDEMEASPEVSKDFVGEVISQKRDAAALVPTPDSHGPDWKRDRHAYKQPPIGQHGCASSEIWDGIFKNAEKKVPRVGKMILRMGSWLIAFKGAFPVSK